MIAACLLAGLVGFVVGASLVVAYFQHLKIPATLASIRDLTKEVRQLHQQVEDMAFPSQAQDDG